MTSGARSVVVAPLMISTDREDRRGLGELLPLHERVRWRSGAVGQTSVGDGEPGEPVWLRGDETKADEAAPVLTEERDVVQVEHVEHEARHPGDVAGIAVVGRFGWLVAPTEADLVRHDDPVPGGHQRRDHVSVQVAPRWLTVEEKHGRGVGRPFVEIVDAQRSAILVWHLGVVGGEREVGQVGETVVGGANGLHQGAFRRAVSRSAATSVGSPMSAASVSDGARCSSRAV